MVRNPIERHTRGLRLNANQVAQKANVSHALISQLFSGKASLTANVAHRIVGSSRINIMSLLVANAIWRRDQDVVLTASEEAFIEAGEVTTGYTPDQLSLIVNGGGGLFYLDSMMTKIPKPPPILLAKRGE